MNEVIKVLKQVQSLRLIAGQEIKDRLLSN